MNNLITFLIFFVIATVKLIHSSEPQSFNITVDSEVSLYNLERTYGKHEWYCFFPSRFENSNLYSKTMNKRSSLIENEVEEKIVINNQEYFIKSLTWDGGVKDNKFFLNFESSGTNLEVTEPVHDGKCTFRTLTTRVSSNNTYVNASGIILVPKSVWLVRVKVHNIDSSSDFRINAQGLLSIESINGELDSTPIDLKSFKNGSESYFLIDDSSRLINITVNSQNNTTKRNWANIKIEVQFITLNECIKNLGNKNINDLIWKDIYSTSEKSDDFELNIDKAIINISCLTTTPYIRYILPRLMIDDLNSIFESFEELTIKIAKDSKKLNHENNQTENLKILRRLVTRTRFYFAYEMTKDMMRYFKDYINPLSKYYPEERNVSGFRLNQMILKILNLNSYTIFRVSSNKITNKTLYLKKHNKDNNKIFISNNDLSYLSDIIEYFLMPEVKEHFTLFNLLIKPVLINSNKFELADFYINRVDSYLNLMLKTMNEIVEEANSGNIKHRTLGYLSGFNQRFFRAAVSYEKEIESLACIFGVSTSMYCKTKNVPEDELESIFRNVVINIFIKNIETLKNELSRFYINGFEDNEIKDLYTEEYNFYNLEEFIDAFKKLSKIGEE
jgi:hypothetical protein